MGEAYEREMGEGDWAGGKEGVGRVLGFDEVLLAWLHREAQHQEAQDQEREQREAEEVDEVSFVASLVAQVEARRWQQDQDSSS